MVEEHGKVVIKVWFHLVTKEQGEKKRVLLFIMKSKVISRGFSSQSQKPKSRPNTKKGRTVVEGSKTEDPKTDRKGRDGTKRDDAEVPHTAHRPCPNAHTHKGEVNKKERQPPTCTF